MKIWKPYITINQGFTLIETLLALFCVMMSMLILTPCVHGLKTMSQDFRSNDDRIAVYQLRCMLAQASTIILENDRLHFLYHNQPTRLEFDRHRLVRRDGYEIFLENINEASFHMKSDCFYLKWSRGEQTHEVLLTCQ